MLEPADKLEHVTALRMGGVRALAWSPFGIKHLTDLSLDQIGIFVVMFSAEERCAEAIGSWAKAQSRPVLHISSQDAEGALRPEHFTIDVLRAYCIEAFEKSPDFFSSEQRGAAEAAFPKWTEPPLTPSGLTAKGHNITKPNYMVLRRAARSVAEGEPFIGNSEIEYTNVILEAARAVIAVREQVGLYGFHYITLLRPELILAEPALFRPRYKAIKPKVPFEEKTVAKTLRWLQTQKGLWSAFPVEYVRDLEKSPTARALLGVRAGELDTFTVGVGLRAAQTVSAVVRLSPGVNHVFQSLSAYARNVRSPKREARRKTPRLFNNIQNQLRTAVGKERLAFIQERQWPVKLVCDAPMEWLPVGNLPLAMQYDCSRINATPGNLLMGLLVEPRPIVLAPEHLLDILIVSAFADDDPLKDVLSAALKLRREVWEERANITFKSAQTKQEFVEALNGFDGAILIFDGHGANNADEPVGKLMLGREAVDVWELRRKVRMPPIVLLSACDTQGLDASSHATVGNGFLALGALAVLATLLPVGGVSSAGLISRLVYRITDFVPGAIAARRRALNWTEVISGMLRMFLASELVAGLVGLPDGVDTARRQLQIRANEDINLREDEHWFDNLLGGIAEHRKQDIGAVRAKAQSIIARAEAIRYVQLGNPELIIIDDGRTKDRLAEDADAMAAHLAEARLGT